MNRWKKKTKKEEKISKVRSEERLKKMVDENRFSWRIRYTSSYRTRQMDRYLSVVSNKFISSRFEVHICFSSLESDLLLLRMPSESSNNEANTSSSATMASTNGPSSLQTDHQKQLMKLRRFLSTLYHFGSDISSEIGERVRALILALLNNALSVDEFHGKIQSTTNFPLRPFALPFLQSTLPLLQKELLQLARQSKQSTSQYLAQHEEFILLPRESSENSSNANSPLNPTNENGKRPLIDEFHSIDKRTSNHSTRTFFTSNSISTRRDLREKDRTFSTYLREYTADYGKSLDDEWKNAENMLNCILEMVTKTKRVLSLLQQKDHQLRRIIETNDIEWRRRHTELVAQTEDRIVDMRRKAEETVLEIKRQSMLDLQKAISQSEQKSTKLLIREREQFQRLNQEFKVQTFEEAYALLNRQDDGPEQCWHCGRKAIETCSGCNLARYCGQYCQHRDWDHHQSQCGPDLKRKYLENPQLCRRFASKNVLHLLSKESPDVNIVSTDNDKDETSDGVKCESV